MNNSIKIVGDISSTHFEGLDSVRKGIAFENRHGMGNRVAGIDNQPGGSTTGVERKYSLNGKIKLRHLECFKHDLGDFFSFAFRVLGTFCLEHWMLIR